LIIGIIGCSVLWAGMTPKKPEVMADARFEHPQKGEESRFRGDMTIVRSSHGITAVRQRVCVSNDIAVHALEVDVQPGPAWAQVASESHARLSIVLEAIGGGRIESRLKRDQVPANGPFTMNFAPPGAEVWAYSDGIRRVRMSGSTSISRGFQRPSVSD